MFLSSCFCYFFLKVNMNIWSQAKLVLCEGEQEGNDDLKLLGVEFSTAQLGKYEAWYAHLPFIKTFLAFNSHENVHFNAFHENLNIFPTVALKPLMPSAKLRNWEFTKKFTIFSNQRRKKGPYLAKSPTSKSLSLLCEARKESWIRSTL